MTPKDSYHLVSMLLCNPVPLSVDWTECVSQLTNKILEQ